ncbi:AI-2E family transporter [Methanobacterium alcaliphilum]|uniref:AI-2E family transporter n=1 Tax=Methanobacterium alcaliphilum TaxID=392018 RepID=UPI00200AAD5B|nr:AI-2E family transporter [Methanobacterium alcaliphilum]MCK9151486.1 AI-2E family transporter [Methanobacterium alcaliphilum]
MIYKLKGTVTSAIFVVLILSIFSLLVISPVLDMILLGAIFAYGIRPISSKLEPYFRYQSLSIILAMVIVILPLIALTAYTVGTIVNSAPYIVGAAKNVGANNFNQTINQTSLSLHQHLPVAAHPYINSFLNSMGSIINGILNGIVNYAVDLIKSLPTLALQLFIFFTATFYLAKDGDKITDYVSSTIPHDRKSFFSRMSKEVDLVLKSIFYGHFLTALIIGIMAAVGFYILGYSYALFLGILTGFLQLIPIIGPWPVYTVMAIFDLASGNILRGIIVLLFGFFLSGSDIYIRPKISGKYADIHPMIFLLGFLCGPLVLGIVGFILGPLILGVTYAALVAYKKSDLKIKKS